MKNVTSEPEEFTFTVLGAFGILLVGVAIVIRGYYGIWVYHSYSLIWIGGILALASLYFYRDLIEKGKSNEKNIPLMLGLTAMAILIVSLIAELLYYILFFEMLLHIEFFFYRTMEITIPCLLIALLVKKYRKKAVVPPMIACGLSAIFYFIVFQDIREMIYFLETLTCLVIFAISYVLYAYLS